MLKWNSEEVTGAISDIIVRDNAGGIADTMTIVFPDPEQAYMSWQPRKGDIISASVDGWNSGDMFFDGYLFSNGNFAALAISTPPDGRTEAFRSWKNVLFSHVAADITAACGLGLKLFGVKDYLFGSIAQGGEPNLGFLNRLCEREGWRLKVHDKVAVIFDEKTLETSAPALSIDLEDMEKDFRFGSAAVDLKSSCRISYFGETGLINYNLVAPGIYGGSIRPDFRAVSLGEAQRFARGALRCANRDEYAGVFRISLNSKLAAGNTINLTGMGALNGTWYLTQVEQYLQSNWTKCRCRRPIEGDY